MSNDSHSAPMSAAQLLEQIEHHAAQDSEFHTFLLGYVMLQTQAVAASQRLFSTLGLDPHAPPAPDLNPTELFFSAGMAAFTRSSPEALAEAQRFASLCIFNPLPPNPTGQGRGPHNPDA